MLGLQTYAKAKFSHIYEAAFGEYLDAGDVPSPDPFHLIGRRAGPYEAVVRFGSLLEWTVGMYGQEIGLRESVAWSLRARYLLLYHEAPLPLPAFAQAYKVPFLPGSSSFGGSSTVLDLKARYGEELGTVLRRMGAESLEEAVSGHSHVLVLVPGAGLAINPTFLASLARFKADIVLPPFVAPSPIPSHPHPCKHGDGLLRWGRRR